MTSIQHVLVDFYSCTQIPIQFLDHSLNSLFKVNITTEVKRIVDRTTLIHDLNQTLSSLTTLTYLEQIHFIVLPLFNHPSFKGYFVVGPFHSSPSSNEVDLVYKPFSCIPFIGKLLESIVKQQLFSSPKFNNYVNEGIKFIHKHYKQTITLNDLCQYLSINKSYFCSIFKAETGLTFSHFLNRVRIEKSKQYLIDSNESILSIALSVGFNNHTYYSMIFKKITGMTPLEFRQQKSTYTNKKIVRN